VFGGSIARGREPVHGKTSRVFHDGRTIFSGVESPLTATRYHSLVAESPLPDELELTAWTEDDVVMGVRHLTLPALEGVQFHPESILTGSGRKILGNFLNMGTGGDEHA
jgi:para-aminobenzoate synthetase component 2